MVWLAALVLSSVATQSSYNLTIAAVLFCVPLCSVRVLSALRIVESVEAICFDSTHIELTLIKINVESLDLLESLRPSRHSHINDWSQ